MFHVYILIKSAHVALTTFSDEVAIALLLSLGEDVGGLRAHIRDGLKAVSNSVLGKGGLGLPRSMIPKAKSARADVSKWLAKAAKIHTSRDVPRFYLDQRSECEGLSADDELLAQFCLAARLVEDRSLLVFGPWLPSLICSSGLPPHLITDSKVAIEVIKQCENVVSHFGNQRTGRPKLLTDAVFAEAKAIKEAHQNGDWVDLATRIVTLSISRTDHLEIMKVRTHARGHTHDAWIQSSFCIFLSNVHMLRFFPPFPMITGLSVGSYSLCGRCSK